MTKLRPYLALDIETTGLDVERVHALQIGWVIDDGVSPLADLKRGSVIINVPRITYGEPYALWLNAWIFDEMVKASKGKSTKYPVLDLGDALNKLAEAIRTTHDLTKKFDESNGEHPKKVQIAGKNAGSFDWPIILNNAKPPMDNAWIREAMYAFEGLVDHRFIDCGAIFFELFGKNPGFEAINKLMQYKSITHDALDDALNVVVALRYRMGMNF
jgi:oligoribonuclease (3'-5' exoribonuclease)